MTKDIHLSTIQQKPTPVRKRSVMLSEAVSDSIAPANPSKEDVDVNYSASYIFTCE